MLAAYQAQTFLINREIKKQLPEYLRGIGFKRELVSFKAELDPSLIKRGNVVDITDTVLEQGRVLGAGGQKVKTGRYILKSPVPDGQNEKIEVQLEPSNLQPDETPEVSTIDRYQGAENEIVIVSLVRSNAEKKLGFLGTEDGRNRMCALGVTRFATRNKCHASSNKKLLETSATLVVTSALLVVTRSY